MRASSNAPPVTCEARTAPPENGGTGEVSHALEMHAGRTFDPLVCAGAMEALLHELEGILASLEALSSRQGDCIASGRVDDLLKVLGQRQELVNRFLAVQSDLSALKNMLDEHRQVVDQAVMDRLHDRMQLLDSMLQRVLEQDDRDHAVMLQQRAVVEHRVNELDAGVRARSRYASVIHPPVARHVDAGAQA